MSHPEQMNFVKELKNKFSNYFVNSKILEIGSLNVNGTIRKFFENCEYIGVDVGSGKCVDVVCEGQKLNYPDNSFDTTASCECFEHNPFWLETFINMHRMTKLNGLLFFTCATIGRKEHGTNKHKKNNCPLTEWDYYKNLEEKDFKEKLNFESMFSEYSFEKNTKRHDLYFYGIKK